eukprot:NODE_1888_length_1345_cov_38.041872_g1793_i0.p1 GENE.NODE_1888_length_1345_cov_38.041872_g1793_i0~~NODE_1888_length_1345_cov_38.041872_g1793_i0.p1  ORF type:complete len:373 (-),score=95.72 NODE_1888_length_1345_cov_38.041872_g1793_i0:158-1276(-)
MPIRRMGSFAKMDGILSDVEAWFFADPGLAQCINAFTEQHVDDFIVDSQGADFNEAGAPGVYLFTADAEDVIEEDHMRRAHSRKLVHSQFCELFEHQLEEFIKQRNVTHEEFQEVFAISHEEELAGGTPHRWIHCTDYEVFLRLMQAKRSTPVLVPMAFLRDEIVGLMQQARLCIQRKKEILPLLDKWDLDDFNSLVKVLHCPASPLHQLHTEHKYLARWRVRLIQAQRAVVPPTTPRQEMADYLQHCVRQCSPLQFQTTMAYLHQHVDAMPLSPLQRQRRHAWQVFHNWDEACVGVLKYESVLRAMERTEEAAFSGKNWKKATRRCAARLKVSNTEKLLITLQQFQVFIAELFPPPSQEAFPHTRLIATPL